MVKNKTRSSEQKGFLKKGHPKESRKSYIKIKGITCTSCAQTIQKAFESYPEKYLST